jgi:hypothetical protein
MPLSTDELDAITHLIAPLPPAVRGDFVAAIEAALQGREHGPGLAHRVAVELQRNFFKPPAPSPRPQLFNSRRFPPR